MNTSSPHSQTLFSSYKTWKRYREAKEKSWNRPDRKTYRPKTPADHLLFPPSNRHAALAQKSERCTPGTVSAPDIKFRRNGESTGMGRPCFPPFRAPSPWQRGSKRNFGARICFGPPVLSSLCVCLSLSPIHITARSVAHLLAVLAAEFFEAFFLLGWICPYLGSFLVFFGLLVSVYSCFL